MHIALMKYLPIILPVILPVILPIHSTHIYTHTQVMKCSLSKLKHKIIMKKANFSSLTLHSRSSGWYLV